MADITLDLAQFRERFPAFAGKTDGQIEMYWDMAVCYISDSDYGSLMGDCRALAIQFMAAHLLALADMVAAKMGNGGIVNASTIDKISVTLQQMPVSSQWQWWLGHSPYGSDLLALLQANAVGGFYIGGAPEQSAFRKVFGGF